MSEVDFESQVSSEDEKLGDEKLVPVGEAIRYRKRAQIAERQVAGIEEELKAIRKENEQLAGQLKEVKLEGELVSKLTSAGAVDLEAVVLMAKARMEQSEGDIDLVVEQLRKEKGYLFESLEADSIPSRTTGVKERQSGGRRVLENAAKRAATSGSRADVQEYLKVRRQFV